MPMVIENLAIVLVGLLCVLYEQSSRATIMLVCDQCLREAYGNEVPFEKWFIFTVQHKPREFYS
jgi:hypothetical protein